MEIAAGNLPLVMINSLFEKSFRVMQEEKKEKDSKVIIEQLPFLYEDYIGKKGSEFEFNKFYDFIKNNALGSKIVFDMSEAGINSMNLILALMPELLTKTGLIIESHDQIESELDRIDSHLALDFDEKNVKKLHDDLKDLIAQKAILEEKMLQIEKQKELCEQDIYNIDKRYKKILDQAVHEMEKGDSSKRIIEYSDILSKVLLEYKGELQKSKIVELQNTMIKCICKITSKDGLIEKVTIDPNTLEFKYYNKKGEDVNKSSLSAGEKQLLVIGMLWALGICSQKELPIIIDTPLARLDSFHRKCIIKNYLPKASKQVIILSTDQEVTKEDYEDLRPFIGKEYTLVYDDDSMSTQIEKGYFGGN